jgi:uncharacterized protein (TIGR03382 family)
MDVLGISPMPPLLPFVLLAIALQLRRRLWPY